MILSGLGMQKKQRKGWGFDTATIDRSVGPQDDFYHFANGAWLKKNKIPETESRWGSFTILRYQTEHQLHALITSLLTKKQRRGTHEQLVADLYVSASNMKRRGSLGTQPIEGLRKKIRRVSSQKELLECIAHLHTIGVSPLWNVFLDQDSKNSSRYLLHLFQGGLSLPEREYYLKKGAEQRRVRDAFRVHMKRLLALYGIEKGRAIQIEKIVMGIETDLAKASMRKEDTRDSEKTYHLKRLGTFSTEVSSFDWKRYFALLGVKNLREMNVGQPDFFKRTATMLASRPLEDWKMYLEWHLLSESAPLLSLPFVKETFNFYGKVLSGTKKMKPLWRRSLGTVNGNVGQALGRLYVGKYFSKEAKKRMDELVDDLFDAYETRRRNLAWMSPATKKKALAKLRLVNRKIGYPSKWRSYRGLSIRRGDFYGNMLRLATFDHRRFLKKLHGPVDRHEWFMNPQTVNAYCHFNLNDITFPAAILQHPFFSLHADDAVNYAAIGSVIGHEMTHAFDDQGSKFDGKGNMRKWWTAKDRARFDAKGKSLVRQFNSYEAADGVMVNGQLTLGENIADLGGLVIAFDAYQKRLEHTGRKDIAGHSPEGRFFLGFAQQERELVRKEFEKMSALTDPHSPGIYRINGPLSNFDSFYSTFGLKKKNKLYRSPKERARIW